ncbi:hypothetical protein HanRHA438_Chr08g0370941 [Helianthus annuus]|nr:hypothetical protein HanRHA438_Chr08g0370941 [Helianthus annuus]
MMIGANRAQRVDTSVRTLGRRCVGNRNLTVLVVGLYGDDVEWSGGSSIVLAVVVLSLAALV